MHAVQLTQLQIQAQLLDIHPQFDTPPRATLCYPGHQSAEKISESADILEPIFEVINEGLACTERALEHCLDILFAEKGKAACSIGIVEALPDVYGLYVRKKSKLIPVSFLSLDLILKDGLPEEFSQATRDAYVYRIKEFVQAGYNLILGEYKELGIDIDSWLENSTLAAHPLAIEYVAQTVIDHYQLEAQKASQGLAIYENSAMAEHVSMHYFGAMDDLTKAYQLLKNQQEINDAMNVLAQMIRGNQEQPEGLLLSDWTDPFKAIQPHHECKPSKKQAKRLKNEKRLTKAAKRKANRAMRMQIGKLLF